MSKFDIQRWSQSITIAADGTTANTTASLNGLLVGVLADVPSLVGTTTLTIAITDAGGYTIYSKASIAEGGKFTQFVDANNHPLRLPLSGTHTITVTASNTQTGAEAVIPVVLLIDRG